MSFVRQPADRLRSMYEFDRLGARNSRSEEREPSAWHRRLVDERGEKPFEACLLDEACVGAMNTPSTAATEPS